MHKWSVGKTRSKWINLIIIIQVIYVSVYAIDVNTFVSSNDVFASKFTARKLRSKCLCAFTGKSDHFTNGLFKCAKVSMSLFVYVFVQTS